MDKLFLTILNMSLVGTFVIAVICLARLLLAKTPKIISYCLWAAAGFRLLFPGSVDSGFSLIPFRARAIPPDIANQPMPRIDSGVTVVDKFINDALPAAAPGASANPLQAWVTVGAVIWLSGVIVMLVCGIASYASLKYKLRNAVYAGTYTLEDGNISAPFVLGALMPKIYIPAGLSEKEREYVILHEQTHIRRYDHFVKSAAYLILCLHWFNPLVWAAYWLMGKDMEMACDERVLREMGDTVKKDYSLSLLALATERRYVNGGLLAFGEGGMKGRIKNVLNFKKPSLAIVAGSAALAVVLGAGLISNPTYAADALKPGQIFAQGEDVNMNGMLCRVNSVEIIEDFQGFDWFPLSAYEEHSAEAFLLGQNPCLILVNMTLANPTDAPLIREGFNGDMTNMDLWALDENNAIVSSGFSNVAYDLRPYEQINGGGYWVYALEPYEERSVNYLFMGDVSGVEQTFCLTRGGFGFNKDIMENTKFIKFNAGSGTA